MINLARNPFVNRRPVQRTTAALWTLALLLGLMTLFLYARYQSDSAASRNELLEVRRQVDAEVEAARLVESALRGFGLAEQNERIAFLNEKIAERAFPWSRLFDDLAAAMPARVKLNRLTPQLTNQDRRKKAMPRSGGEPIRLTVHGEADSPEALLEFVDRLFASSAFGDPQLDKESDKGGALSFSLEVAYLPAALGASDDDGLADPTASAIAGGEDAELDV